MLFARASRSFARALSSTPRLTKIVATIGPASEQAEPLGRCLVAGINVMRVNFSHATVDEFHLRRTNLRAAAGGELVPIMLDTKGPEIRMGGLAVCKEGGRKAKITLTAGAEVLLTTDPRYDGEGDEKTIFVGYPLLASKVSPGFVVLLDDGLVSLRVKEVRPDGGVACEVLNTSPIGERKGVNLPGIVTDLPPLSDKDLEDIRFGIEHDIDMVAASFVRNAAGVDAIRAHIADCHAKHAPDPSAPPPLIISKVESTEALDRLGEIIEASDGLMVARGDLVLRRSAGGTAPEERALSSHACGREQGVEVPIAHVATWQKEMVAKCAEAGKPVVVATQMLDSMQSNPRPTRAEVADVTNAVLEQADAVMLSGESANGQYPAEAVAMQAGIIEHTEAWAASHPEHSSAGVLDTRRTGGAIVPAAAALHPASLRAAHLAASSGAAVILVAEGGSGEVAKAVAACKTAAPVVVFCSSLKVCRQLGIYRALLPLHTAGAAAPPTAAEMVRMAGERGLLREGEPYVVLDSAGMAVASV